MRRKSEPARKSRGCSIAGRANERAGWLTFDVTGLVGSWLKDPQANLGLLITGEATNAVQYDITSADSRDQQHRPRLTLTLPTGAILFGPRKTPTPTMTPTVDVLRPESVDALRLLPRGSTLLARGAGNLLQNSAPEIVAAYHPPNSTDLRIAVFTYPSGTGAAGDYRLYWSSSELGGAAPVSVDIVDITGDGVPEIMLGAASPGGSGQLLFVFVRRPLDLRLAAPVGGHFDGKNYYGESGYDLADVNNDGRAEIRARHEGQVDIYAWDGVNFVALK